MHHRGTSTGLMEPLQNNRGAPISPPAASQSQAAEPAADAARAIRGESGR